MIAGGVVGGLLVNAVAIRNNWTLDPIKIPAKSPEQPAEATKSKTSQPPDGAGVNQFKVLAAATAASSRQYAPSPTSTNQAEAGIHLNRADRVPRSNRLTSASSKDPVPRLQQLRSTNPFKAKPTATISDTSLKNIVKTTSDPILNTRVPCEISTGETAPELPIQIPITVDPDNSLGDHIVRDQSNSNHSSQDGSINEAFILASELFKKQSRSDQPINSEPPSLPHKIPTEPCHLKPASGKN